MPLPSSGTPCRAAQPPHHIVGIGASAGGLAALEQFLAQVPRHSGLAFIVVQHLDPTRSTLLTELLQRATALPVREASESMPVEPDTVYAISPNTELTLIGARLHLARPGEPRGRRLPIDLLFSSLAREMGPRAVGVLLSGMGCDGTLGLQAIQAQGGLSLVQQPETAQFDAMPRSALAAGCVDIVAPAHALPARLLAALVAAPLRPTAVADAGADVGTPDADTTPALAAILRLLREHKRHDFRPYKPSTLLRRIERRMAVHGLSRMEAYAQFLQHNAQELELLFKELLIGVTGFFRDPAVWQELQQTVLPALLARGAAESGRLRAWVAGCSTGEEAYSLAMLFQELRDAQPALQSCTLQIFATDLSPDAIAAARRGQFPASIAATLSPQRLARFFTAQAGGYRIDKATREMLLFAQHDLTLDPPFTKLDLLSCRNLLIYFSAELQQRLLPLFHYSLRPGGVLLLGAAESIGRAQALFTPLRPKSRLFIRNPQGAGGSPMRFVTPGRPPALPPVRSTAQEPPLSLSSAPPANLQALADQLLLQTFSPPAVLVNGAGDIVYISGRTGKFLEPAAGKANWNIHVMARPSIRAQLAVALRSALQDGGAVELRGLRLDEEAEGPLLDITVQALREPQPLGGMAMIVFREQPAAPARRSARGKSSAPDAQQAEALQRAQEEIRALRQAMQAALEELQAGNEELQSTNEELQSANEELTTSQEEAQSMNEELQTINAELQSKLDDLALAQSDMQNLLNSTDIATLFLDNELNVRRFTEQITRVFHLRDGDVGRPLSDLASTLIYPELHADALETLRSLAASEKEIATTDGRWFSVRVMPYRTLSNVIQGVVITFVDISAAKALELRLREA